VARPGQLEPWQRNQMILVLTVGTTMLGVDFSQPFLPLFVVFLGVTDVGEAAIWSGILVGIAPLSAAVMTPIWGSMADRFGYKMMVLRALLMISLTSIAMGASPNIQWAFVGRLLMGAMAGFTPLAMALAINAGPRERMGQAVGMIQAAQFVPLAIAPPIGGLISDRFGLRANFYLSGVIVLLAALVLFFLFKEDCTDQVAAPARKDAPTGRAAAFGLLALPGFAAALFMLYASQFADRTLPVVLPLYLTEVETPPDFLATATGLVVSAGAIAAAISAAIYGRRAGPSNTRRLLMLALGGGALCSLPLALSTEWQQVLVLRTALGLVAGGAMALAYTLGARIAPAERSGLALGLLASCNMIGGASAPLVAGLLGRLNLQWVFLANALMYLLALAVAFSLPGRAGSGSSRERTAS
jgi:DHA1 family multidrug resistance protein-like MFS transporter